jgi:hypothetical protein
MAPRAASNALATGWTALGLAAAGHDPARIRRGRHSAIDYIEAHGHRLTRDGSATGIGNLERTILALRAAGRPVRRVGGHDLAAALRRDVAHDGSVLQQVNLTAFAILALRAAGASSGAPTLRRAGGWLAAHQNGDGGYGFLAGVSSDVDDTAAALEALAALRGHGSALRRGVAFLRAAQNPDGGLGQQLGSTSNAQSTAWAIQGLVAAGVHPRGVHRGGAPSPVAYLRSLIAPDGSVRYSRTVVQTPVWVTATALLGLAERPLPFIRARVANAAAFRAPER